MVWVGTSLALEFGISDLIIGLTVVALGTSLPELAVSVSSALKKQHQMVIGNIIGSNLFNTLGVLAIPGLILPFQIPGEVMSRDFINMIILTLLIVLLAVIFKFKINRFGGFILLFMLGLQNLVQNEYGKPCKPPQPYKSQNQNMHCKNHRFSTTKNTKIAKDETE